jgi:hypothetical protein
MDRYDDDPAYDRENDVYERRDAPRRGGNWLWILPLLLIPLVIWGVSKGVTGYKKNGANNQAYLTNPGASNSPKGVVTGVGGGPGNTTRSSSPSASPTPTSTARGTQVGVGGGPGNTAPSGAPHTGRGR